MKILKFLSGFIWNLISIIIETPIMSWEMGMACVRKDKFFWEVDEIELLEDMEKGILGKDE